MEAARAGAEAELAAALADLERLERRPTEVEVALAEASLRQAEADLESAQGALDQLEISYLPGEPPALELVFAQGEVEIAQAQKALREAELEEVRAGPREHELEIAEAMVEKARARLEQVELRRERSVLRAPIDGRVNQLFIKRGETATQGMTLVEMLDVDNLVLRVYLPEERVASIQVGHPVTIEVDAYPGKAFEGVVRWIADEAQFTPTDVQTREQRVKLVFAVDIQLHDPEGELRIGMPADASFSN
jgi:HlyD family secretion protein